MFKLNDYVFYGLRGVCRVTDMTPCPFDRRDERIFYVLKPVNVVQESTYYVPADNESLPVRPVMTREQADALLHSIGQIEELTILSDKQRRDSCRNTLMENTPEAYVRVIKTLTRRRTYMQQNGRQLSNREAELEHIARTHLTNELSVIFDMDPEQAAQKLNAALEQ